MASKSKPKAKAAFKSKKTAKESKAEKGQAKPDQNTPDKVAKGDKSAGENASKQHVSNPAQQNVARSNTSAEAGWSLEADRMAKREPLIDCLQMMAGHYGRRTSYNGLTAGLPIPKTGITPALFIRAAERADLRAHLTERSLESLAIAPNLPCILTLENGQACILWSVEYPDKHHPSQKVGEKEADIHPETRFEVQFPETEQERQSLTLEELKPIHNDYAFFVRPVTRSDDRAGPAEIDNARDWFWAEFKKHRTIYGEVMIAAVMINLFGIASSLFVMNVYDRVVPNNALDTLWVMTIGILIVYVFDFILRNLRAHFLDHAGRKADIKISASLFEQILGMKMANRPPSAGVLVSNMKEFEGLRDFFTSATLTSIVDLPFVFVFITFIFVLGGPVAFVPLLAIPLVIGVGLILQKPLQKVVKESLNESALKNALMFETMVGLETIKVQAAESHIQRRWEELTEKSSLTSVKSKRITAFASHWAMFVQQLVSVFIVVAGVYLIAAGDISMGALIACVILSGRAMAPLAQVAGLLTRYNQSKEALDQLDELMKKPVERPAGKHFVTQPQVKGLIEYKDVIFHYPGQSRPALNNINFAVQPGDRVGIIGSVGSGKTTLERLLLNLYQPDSGAVQIDGSDVRQIDPGDLRRNVGAVQQSPQLFYGSVRENITMGHETAPDQAVLRAAEISGVLEFLRDSEAGLDTQVGERGEALSGGQRQAVAIARALLYDPPILILDEPTASIDPSSENRLKSRLHQICQGKTTLLITHKGSMLALVDKLILMDSGRIVAYGPRDEVIEKLQGGQYRSAAAPAPSGEGKKS